MNKLEKEWRLAAEELVGEVASMHGTLYTLIIGLGKTNLSQAQRALVDQAYVDLRKSQSKFFTTYGDQIGCVAPGRN